MKTIIINATAARNSGALTVLKDFVEYCKLENHIYQYEYFLLTTVECFTSDDKFKVIKLAPMNWKTRISWDSGGLKKFLEKNNIYPDIIISLQNTCTKYPKIPQLVYYHQALSLIPFKWNLLKKEERKLFLYAHFYKYFVNKNNKYATYVVQLPYLKKLFLKKFKNIRDNNVVVLRPNDPKINLAEYESVTHDYTFIYPATPMVYKNHDCIIKAIMHLKEEKKLPKNIRIIFTISKDSNSVTENIKKYGLENEITCIGMIPYEKLLSLYYNSEVLLYPSKIESYGMPLIEASKFGLTIIASDLPYAKEVLNDYDKKIFINPDNYIEWANVIEQLIVKRQNKIIPEKNELKDNTWKSFLEIANKLMK